VEEDKTIEKSVEKNNETNGLIVIKNIKITS
jgi:hypothetical protein